MDNLDPNTLKQQTRSAYNFLAPAYAEEWSARPDPIISQNFIKRVQMLARTPKVLDAGCGPAHYSKLFQETGFTVFACDISQGMLQQAKRVWAEGKLIEMDLEALAFMNHSFDALWVCASFPHIPESQVPNALAEFRRVLRPNGILFINAIIGTAPFRIESVEEIGENYNRSGRFFQWYETEARFAQYLEQANFRIDKRLDREIHSNVVKKAKIKTNHWANFICVSR